jgi:DNA mismatch repair protein MSH4
MLAKVQDVVSESARPQKGSAPMKLQRCFAIKNGCNALLDLARQTYCEIVDDLERLAERLAGDHGLPIKVAFNASRGYHLQIPGGKKAPLVNVRDLPKTFLHPQVCKGTVSFTTEQVVQMDKRSQESLREITIMSNEIVKVISVINYAYFHA